MPVKWTPETDQILLLKILETSDVSPRCAEIAEKWPTSLDRPTPRAISERIFRIRATAKASGTAGHFSISAAKSNPGTPRKNAANGITKTATPKRSHGRKPNAGKRKRRGNMSDDEATDDSEAEGFKHHNYDPDASDDDTPKKKSKANTTIKAKSNTEYPLKVKSEEEENETLPNNYYENPFSGDNSAEMAV